ncbi:MAG: tetratricopeptide repeat protein [Flavobacteriia bacterium]|nr:tetratricopeptide repeat protein [Flavobacteriia bacterium]
MSVDRALGGEWVETKKVIESLLTEIELNPENYTAKLNLSKGYIQEARITGDHAYYDAAALELLDDVIANEPQNFDALCCKATVLLSQHHFSEALKVAKSALPINPNNAFIYGLMCDSYVELGQYKQAVKMADKMINIRPDIRSYSRVSYLREIHGDLNGAIIASKFAVDAGFPGLEETAWSRMILAHLYEMKGHLDSAEFQYQTALKERPDYAFALAGLGKKEKVNGNYKKAISYFRKAEKAIIEYSFSDELTDLYRLNGDPKNGYKSAYRVIKMLSPLSNDDESVSGHGHYADRELAYAYLKINNTDKALEHAMLEYNRRPKNIDVCETVAWVYYKQKNYAKANEFRHSLFGMHTSSCFGARNGLNQSSHKRCSISVPEIGIYAYSTIRT